MIQRAFAASLGSPVLVSFVVIHVQEGSNDESLKLFIGTEF